VTQTEKRIATVDFGELAYKVQGGRWIISS